MKKLALLLCAVTLTCCVTGCTDTALTNSAGSSETAGISSASQSDASVQDVNGNAISSDVSTDSGSSDVADDGQCRLIVNGKDITEGNYVKMFAEYRQEHLPVLAIAKELGAQIEWQSETQVTLSYNGKSHTLDAKASNFGILIKPGTQNGVRKFINNDFIMEYDSVSEIILKTLGASYSPNYPQRTITISNVQTRTHRTQRDGSVVLTVKD
ncbi:MAG: hypothetical protein IJY56_00295 [Clostridia bacterium]|nr:hypothetical protein [Clostridia bacterium]